jgi:TPR repeat protein
MTQLMNKSFDPTSESFRLWQAGEHKKAFLMLRAAAEGGVVDAWHNLGFFYDEGIGTRRNADLALTWYKRSWREQRHTGTCINISKIYDAKGMRRLARYWTNLAIAAGDGDAALEEVKRQIERGTLPSSDRVKRLLSLVIESEHVSEDSVIEAKAMIRQSNGNSAPRSAAHIAMYRRPKKC